MSSVCNLLLQSAKWAIYITCTGTNNPAEGVFICADGDPLNGSHWIMFYWVAVCSIESCLLSLALYQAWMYRNKGQGGGLMRALTKDSVFYFIM